MNKIVVSFLIAYGYIVSVSAQSELKDSIQVETLGGSINSAFSEIRPLITTDARKLYFVVEGHPKNNFIAQSEHAQDIWVSLLDSNSSTWSAATHLEAPFNTQTINTIFWISADGNKMMVRTGSEAGQNDARGLAIYERINNEWRLVETLVIPELKRMNLGKYFGASMSLDQNAILFYFSETQNDELNDIYVSLRQPDGKWTAPINLGATINDEAENEIAPYLAADGTTLYYSSSRAGGLGSQDIWMTRRLDASWQKWSDPVNLGSPINTDKWDAYLSMDANGEYAYFSNTNNAVGGSDLVKVKLKPNLRPQKMALLFGNVFDALTKKQLDGNLQLTYQAEGDLLPKVVNINASTNTYKLWVPYSKRVNVKVQMAGYLPNNDNVYAINDLSKSNEIQRDIYLTADTLSQWVSVMNAEMSRLKSENDSLKQLAQNSLLATEEDAKEEKVKGFAKKLKNQAKTNHLPILTNAQSFNNASPIIYFETGKAIITKEGYDRLKMLLKQEGKGEKQFIVIGSTDNVGKRIANLKLSLDRAVTVKEFLLSEGIAEEKISVKGIGDSQPKSANDTESGRAKNRNVTIIID